MTIKEKQQNIINDFAFLDDWEQKYEYIIALGKELKGISDDKKQRKTSLKDANLKCGLFPILKIIKFFSM